VKARYVVVLLCGAVLFYMGLILYSAIYLLTQPDLVLQLLAVGIIIIVPIGGWLIYQELRFGQATARLARQLPEDPQAQAQVEALPRRPSGRVDRAAADELFAARRVTVEADPNAWAGWFRLAEAYDLAGDRRRARSAMRTAIDRAAS
jgi:cytochrome c-type biogenesis protein CcmH/NrfG